jgi:hypothetical protein
MRRYGDASRRLRHGVRLQAGRGGKPSAPRLFPILQICSGSRVRKFNLTGHMNNTAGKYASRGYLRVAAGAVLAAADPGRDALAEPGDVADGTAFDLVAAVQFRQRIVDLSRCQHA